MADKNVKLAKKSFVVGLKILVVLILGGIVIGLALSLAGIVVSSATGFPTASSLGLKGILILAFGVLVYGFLGVKLWKWK
jgi:hypothetical protein